MPRLRTLAAAAAFASVATLGCASAPAPESEPAQTPVAPVAVAAPAQVQRSGAYLDRQGQELAAIPDARVAQTGDALIVNLDSGVLFDSSSALLSSRGEERVRQLARTVQAYPKQLVIVKGHTDSQGDERANQRLSEERADSVRNLLVAEGVLPSRITAVGLGAGLPVASNSTAEGRQQNRRVEIELRPDAEVMQAPAPQ